MSEQARALRVDKWLWFTRFYKTRGLAAGAVRGGHVRVNGQRASPATAVRPGDLVEIVRDGLLWRVRADALPSRRGPAVEARACYSEDEASREARVARKLAERMDRLAMPRTDGRPDKHTRRQLRDRRRSSC